MKLKALKKVGRIALIYMIVLSCCLNGNAQASEKSDPTAVTFTARATRNFNIDIAAKQTAQASSSFPLEAGEVVTIKASYSPFSASMDFGLISPDGTFHYVNVTGGSIDKAIRVEERGNYTFAVRNNSNYTVSVSGYVNY